MSEIVTDQILLMTLFIITNGIFVGKIMKKFKFLSLPMENFVGK